MEKAINKLQSKINELKIKEYIDGGDSTPALTLSTKQGMLEYAIGILNEEVLAEAAYCDRCKNRKVCTMEQDDSGLSCYDYEREQ